MALEKALQAELTCQITLEVPPDPVVCREGHLYSEEALLKWVRQSGKAPVGGRKMTEEDYSKIACLSNVCQILQPQEICRADMCRRHYEQRRRIYLTMKKLRGFVAKRGGILYGSFYTREIFDKRLLQEFYAYCSHQSQWKGKEHLAYMNPSVHKESFQVRTRFPRDIDLYLDEGEDVETVVSEMERELLFCRLVQKQGSAKVYQNSVWRKLNTRKERFLVQIPGEGFGSVLSFNMDLCFGALEGFELPLVPFPNVHRLFYEKAEEMRCMGVASGSCVELKNVLKAYSDESVTFTSRLFMQKNEFFGDGKVNLDDMVSDIRYYFQRLQKTLREGWTIENISLELDNFGDLVATRSFTREGRIQSTTLLVIDIDELLENTPLGEMARGVLRTKKDERIYIFHDPDFAVPADLSTFYSDED